MNNVTKNALKQTVKDFLSLIIPIVVVVAIIGGVCTLFIVLATSAPSRESRYPCIQYKNSNLTQDEKNQEYKVKKGYVLDESHSYDIIETENGYDMIIHFIEDINN